MRPTLTTKQQQVLDVIRDHIRETGISPSYAEIANVFGFASTNAAANHIRALVKKGYITWQPGKSRTIQIIGPPWLTLPLVGEFEGGKLTAIEDEDVDFSFLFGGR